jgi:hypothetical protein
MWIASVSPTVLVQGTLYNTTWSYMLTLASLAASMTVNALMTGLIVFKIFKVFRKVKSITTSNEKSLSIAHASRKKLRSIIFIITASGMAVFAIQLAQVVISAATNNNATIVALQLINVIHGMLNVVISSVN